MAPEEPAGLPEADFPPEVLCDGIIAHHQIDSLALTALPDTPPAELIRFRAPGSVDGLSAELMAIVGLDQEEAPRRFGCHFWFGYCCATESHGFVLSEFYRLNAAEEAVVLDPAALDLEAHAAAA